MGETILNIQSSRSHTIFKVGVRMIYRYQYKIYNLNYSDINLNDNERIVDTSLCIVDLAGSERSKRAETQGT
jgi:kinesin family protein 20